MSGALAQAILGFAGYRRPKFRRRSQPINLLEYEDNDYDSEAKFLPSKQESGSP